jgi:signal transduction histidine kinase
MASEDHPAIREGVLDLRNQESPVRFIALDGEWEFYWQQFITPDSAGSRLTGNKLYVDVPSYWVQYRDEIPGVSRTGYGTYRLCILFPQTYTDTLTLHVPVFDSSFDLFLNGKAAGSNGRTASSPEKSRPGYDPFLRDIPISSDTLEILVHVSNYHHRRGGFWKTMTLGSHSYMHERFERNKVITHTLIGLLVGTFFLFLLFYLLDRRKPGFLFFSLTSLGILLRLMNTGEYPGGLFLDLPWEWVVRVEYIGTYLSFIFGILFLVSIFPGSVKKWIVRLNTIVFSAIILLTLVLHVPGFSYFILLLQASLILFLAYFTVYSFLGMLKRKYHETLFFFSIAIFLAATIHDALLSHSIAGASNEYIIPFAFFIIVGSNTMILLNQWVNDYREKERLNLEIETINRNLEKTIESRTKELNHKNKELETSLALKNQLFSIIAHDLKSPISTLAQYTDFMLDQVNLDEQKDIASSVREMTYSLIDLIDNLIYWGMSQRKKIEFHPVSTDMEQLIAKSMNLFSKKMELKNIRLSSEVQSSLQGWCDPLLVSIILRNLLSNATKFTPSGGQITVGAKAAGNHVTIWIRDSGIGMSEDKVTELLNSSAIASTEGTEQEKGTGLGFLVVKELVALNKGSFTLKSEPGKGTEIVFTLPGNHEK